MIVTNVNQSIYEQVFNKYYINACKFYDSDKFYCELSTRKVNSFISLIHVRDKESGNLYAVCILSITHNQLPSKGLNFEDRFLAAVRQDNQSEITKTDIALFQIDPNTNAERNKVHFTISEPLKTYPAWSVNA